MEKKPQQNTVDLAMDRQSLLLLSFPPLTSPFLI